VRLGALALAIVVGWSVAATAIADAVPSPGRPEWHETPMPMPDDPPIEIAAISAIVAAIALFSARKGADG